LRLNSASGLTPRLLTAVAAAATRLLLTATGSPKSPGTPLSTLALTLLERGLALRSTALADTARPPSRTTLGDDSGDVTRRTAPPAKRGVDVRERRAAGDDSNNDIDGAGGVGAVRGEAVFRRLRLLLLLLLLLLAPRRGAAAGVSGSDSSSASLSDWRYRGSLGDTAAFLLRVRDGPASGSCGSCLSGVAGRDSSSESVGAGALGL